MDTLTHIALGACIGELLGGKELGKKALLAGAIAQNIPDLDVVTALWMDPSAAVLAHRGITHSFFFAAFASLGFALLIHRRRAGSYLSFRFWFTFLAVQLVTHALLDAMNAYGAGWLEPFSHHRFAFHTLFVVDPFFALPITVGALLLVIKGFSEVQKIRVALWSIIFSMGYLGYAIVNKARVEIDLRKALQEQQVPYTKYFTTPTPLNTWLWFMAAVDDNGAHIAHRSVFDNGKIDFTYFPRHNEMLPFADRPEDVSRLKRFSQDFYAVERRGDTLIFNDLRFGQMAGWSDPHADFVFHYYLHPALDNILVMQRGRTSDWHSQTIKGIVKRIRGK